MEDTMKRWIRESRFGQWTMNKTLRDHMKHPCRQHFGPARCTFLGWLYFRVLCGIHKFDDPSVSVGYGI